MHQSKKYRAKRGAVIVTLLFAVMIGISGCGKADKAYDKAMGLAEEGKYEEAAKSFEKAIKINHEKAEYYIGYGMTLNHLGDYKKAIKQFEKAYQEMDNKISRKNNKQLYYGEALAYYGMHKYDKALERCQNALEIDGQTEIDCSVYATMGVLYWASGDFENAQKSLDELLQKNKKDVEGYLQRGQLYMNMGEPESAQRDFSQALQLDKNCYDAYFGLYDAYRASGQVDAAKESLEMLTGIHAKSAEQKMQVGRAYQVLGEEDQAVSYLKDALKQKCTEANYYLGLVQMAKKDYESALGYFEKYISDATVIQIPDVYNQIAGALIETNEYERAEKYLEEGLELGMSSAYQGLLRNQVILLEKQQKFSEAQKAAKAYHKAYPGDAAMAKELEFIKTRIQKKTTDDQKQDAGTTDQAVDSQSSAKPVATGQPSATPGQTAEGQASSTPDQTAAGASSTPDQTAAGASATPDQTDDSDSNPGVPSNTAGSRHSVISDGN